MPQFFCLLWCLLTIFLSPSFKLEEIAILPFMGLVLTSLRPNFSGWKCLIWTFFELGSSLSSKKQKGGNGLSWLQCRGKAWKAAGVAKVAFSSRLSVSENIIIVNHTHLLRRYWNAYAFLHGQGPGTSLSSVKLLVAVTDFCQAKQHFTFHAKNSWSPFAVNQACI